ncbi:YkgJ family cysteine cluster protein [Mariniphaga sediminis]|uniref:YkgJ family cysteine cluster protein n=1 Tax=Mariniphaga sediminis TaxID=1628158 RepID=A0A399D1Q3_9BACT|nr:YkgJ family cysteine cluster protein [Mariniphaga sediminis]RIH65507.1 YkgJ family cysteine cluster protein [Mariniphaga sediminis]
MEDLLKKHFLDYFAVRDDVDVTAERLGKEHAPHLQCEKGCDLCCMDFSILPIEFYAILEELKSNKFDKTKIQSNAPNNKDSCIFLKDHACTIYKSRPLICRTHGLPLLFANDDGEWELSACELNFTQFNFEKFSVSNTYPQDKFNSRLFLLNRKFISEFGKGKDFGEFDLLPLKELVEKL